MRRIASVLALLGCILHATLLPMHAARAQGAAMSDISQLSQDLLVICHGDGTGVAETGVPASPAPDDKKLTDCLICKGIVGFQLVILAAAELGLLMPEPVKGFVAASDATSADGIVILPRSRGPPLSV